MRTAEYWIQQLDLQEHPEGGFFRETYRSHETIPPEALPERFSGARSFATAIYFLLKGDDFSAFHRIKSDELWHFHAGRPLTLHMIDSSGRYQKTVLGENPQNGEVLQATVPEGCWFAAETLDRSGYTLVGCTVAPGFDFADFEMGRRSELIELYPDHRQLIKTLTR
jgi:predicted cupin superfamily sugar epimerase